MHGTLNNGNAPWLATYENLLDSTADLDTFHGTHCCLMSFIIPITSQASQRQASPRTRQSQLPCCWLADFAYTAWHITRKMPFSSAVEISAKVHSAHAKHCHMKVFLMQTFL